MAGQSLLRPLEQPLSMPELNVSIVEKDLEVQVPWAIVGKKL